MNKKKLSELFVHLENNGILSFNICNAGLINKEELLVHIGLKTEKNNHFTIFNTNQLSKVVILSEEFGALDLFLSHVHLEQPTFVVNNLSPHLFYLREEMQAIAILLEYKEQFDPDFIPDISDSQQKKYTPIYIDTSTENYWELRTVSRSFYIGQVSFSFEACELLVQKLNDGLIPQINSMKCFGGGAGNE